MLHSPCPGDDESGGESGGHVKYEGEYQPRTRRGGTIEEDCLELVDVRCLHLFKILRNTDVKWDIEQNCVCNCN